MSEGWSLERGAEGWLTHIPQVYRPQQLQCVKKAARVLLHTFFVEVTVIEVWKNVIGYEGKYEVSSLGNVRSLKREQLLTPYPLGNGYLHVKLSKNSKGKSCSVHGLVSEAFHGDRPKGWYVNHVNGVKHDNRASNLVRNTRRESATCLPVRAQTTHAAVWNSKPECEAESRAGLPN
jgi:hypothetical protein